MMLPHETSCSLISIRNSLKRSIMSSISNISGSSNLSYLQPTTNATKQVGGSDVDGDNDGGSKVGRVGRSNFMSAIEEALGQTLSGSSGASSATSTSGSSSSTSSTQDPQTALQAFLHSLFSAMHQMGGQGNGAAATGNDADGNSSASGVGRHHHHHHGGSNLTASIQNLLQQLSSNSQSGSTNSQSSSSAGQGGGTDALSNLNSSFQNLINTINASQGQGAPAATPTLQAFMQNLLQDLKSGQNISGAVVSVKV